MVVSTPRRHMGQRSVEEEPPVERLALGHHLVEPCKPWPARRGRCGDRRRHPHAGPACGALAANQWPFRRCSPASPVDTHALRLRGGTLRVLRERLVISDTTSHCTNVGHLSEGVSVQRGTVGVATQEGAILMGKPSKAQLSKAGRTLASDSSSKPAKSKAASTLGKG